MKVQVFYTMQIRDLRPLWWKDVDALINFTGYLLVRASFGV